MQQRLRAVSAVTLALAFAAAAAPAQDRPPAADRAPRAAVKHYNLGKKGLAVQGYDPVAYFAEGGGKARKGSPRYTTTHRGVTYRFANQQNLERFRKTPTKYEPAYGGWCAYAMREGDKVEVDAEAFLIQDGRLMLFYNGFWGNTRKSWSKGDTAAQAKSADKQWQKLSGERAPGSAQKKSKPKKSKPKEPASKPRRG